MVGRVFIYILQASELYSGAAAPFESEG